jgi:hypothetical protein
VSAVGGLAGCVLRTAALVATGRVRQPRTHVGEVLHFADGTHGRIYRETVVPPPEARQPVTLIVTFRLRGVRGRGHTAFRAESLLNTPLFVGFPGFVSKLWVAHDECGRYRGVYEWDGAELAHRYVGALRWVLGVVSVPGSVHDVVVDGVHRDAFLADSIAPAHDEDNATGWWRPEEPNGPAEQPGSAARSGHDRTT